MLGIDTDKHDIRFVEDDWESPTLRCLGPRLGSVVRWHGSQHNSLISNKLAALNASQYLVKSPTDLERLAMYIQGVENVYDLDYNGQGVSYGDIFLENEKQFSAYNLEHATTDILLKHFEDAEAECQQLDRKEIAPASL